jgi:hypothetical protein
MGAILVPSLYHNDPCKESPYKEGDLYILPLPIFALCWLRASLVSIIHHWQYSHATTLTAAILIVTNMHLRSFTTSYDSRKYKHCTFHQFRRCILCVHDAITIHDLCPLGSLWRLWWGTNSMDGVEWPCFMSMWPWPRLHKCDPGATIVHMDTSTVQPIYLN